MIATIHSWLPNGAHFSADVWSYRELKDEIRWHGYEMRCGLMRGFYIEWHAQEER